MFECFALRVSVIDTHICLIILCRADSSGEWLLRRVSEKLEVSLGRKIDASQLTLLAGDTTVDDLSAPLLSLAASRAGTRSSVAGIDLAPRSGDLPPISVRISDDLLEATANGGDPGVALDASQAEAAPQADVPAAAAAFETRGVSGGPASPARQPIFGLPSANVAAGKGPDALPAEFYTREGVPERLALVASRNAGVSLGRRNYAHRLSSASVFLNFNAGADPSVSGSPAIAKGSPLSGPSSSLASAPVEAASPEEAPIDDPIEQDSDAHLDEIIAQLTESVEADNSPPVPNEPSSPTPVSRSASTLSNLSSKSSFASSNELLAETATAQESEADEADLSPPMSAPTPPVPDSGSKEVEQPALSPAPSTEQLAPLPEPAPVAGTVSLPPPIVTTAPEDQAPIIAQALPLFNPFAPFAFGDPPADTSALVEVPGILRCAFVFVRCADLPAVQTEEALSESLESSGRARVCYAWDIPNDATVQMIREEARRVWAAHRANPAPVESTPVEADDEVDPGDVVLRFANTHGLLVELFDGTQLLHNISVLPFWLRTGATPTFYVSQASAQISTWMTSTGRRVRGQTEAQRLAARELRHSELLLNKRISHLIDFGLYRFVQTTDREVLTFRRRMVGLRWRALAQRAGRHLHEGADGSSSATHASPRIHPADYMTEPFLDTLPFDLEPHIAQGSSPALAVTDATDTAPRRAVIRLNVMVGSVNRAVLAQVDETVDQLITNNVLKFWRKLSLPEDSTCDDYVLKLAGSADYLGGPHPLLSFEAIRRAVSRRESIVVRLLPKGDLLTQDSQWTENWDLIEDTVGRAGTHQQLSSLDRAPEDIRTLSLWDLHQPLRVRVLGLDNLSAALAAGAAAAAAADKSLPALEQVYVEAALYHGGELLGITSAAGDDELAVREAATRRSVRRTTFAAVGSQLSGPGGPGLGHIRWDSWLTFGVRLQDLPRATRLCLTVYGRAGSGTGSGTAIPLGWVNFLLMDSAGQLAQGVIGGLHLWPSEAANPIGCCVPNPCPDAAKRFTLYLQLDEYSVPVMHPDELPGLDLAPKTGDISPEGTEAATLAMGDGPKPAPVPEAIEQPAPAELAILERVRQMDPLSKLDPGTKRLVWRHRRFLRQRYPDALPKLLLSAPWDRQADVAEARELVANWPRLEPEAALELLDANFADAHVRAFAVAHLAHLDNAVLVDFLVQLIQVLKYEPYHDSALARFLLRRALASRRVGHHFFWHLRAEMHWPEIQVRFALYLETYLRGAGSYLRHLERQSNVIGHLARAALAIKPAKNSERRAILHRHLADLAPGVMGAGMEAPFELSLNPRWEASGVLVDRCKFMGSKKLPLWLVFENADAPHGPPHHVIFKSGDDLRQDMLTLQMIGLMDKMWKRHGLDLRMLPYGCISLGDQVGMIEVVLNAETVSDIQFMYGGSTAAFRETPIADWLRGLHKNEEDYMKAVDNFTLSCAGYCVATYILGIGDRHNDNIMVTTSGQLFHIDYGHFLGNIKRKFGWKRERAPFVLTPDFVYLMETKCPNEFERFQDLCVQAYLIVRRDARLFLNLFAMMLSTGIPELKHADDIGYLRDALCLDLSPEEAAAEFRSLISESLRLGWSTQLNWLIHNLVHQR